MTGATGFIDLNQAIGGQAKRLLISRRNEIRDGKCCRRPPTCGEHDDIRRRVEFRHQEGGEAHAGLDSPR